MRGPEPCVGTSVASTQTSSVAPPTVDSSASRVASSALPCTAVEPKVETIFGDSIAGIEELREGVLVRFDRGRPRRFDLVIGADGLHSRVREVVFGPESLFEQTLGYEVAAFEVEGYRPRDENVYVAYSLPDRQVARFATRCRDDAVAGLALRAFREAVRDPAHLWMPGAHRGLDAARQFDHGRAGLELDIEIDVYEVGAKLHRAR